MQIQKHRYALEQGTLCVHVLYLEYMALLEMSCKILAKTREINIVRIIQESYKYFMIFEHCMVHVILLLDSCKSLQKS